MSLSLLVLALASCGLAGCGNQTGSGPELTLISLGDSLAVGVQPRLFGGGTETAQGYPRQLATLLRNRGRRVKLVELGCGAATSSSVISGGRECAPKRSTPYRNEDPASSQLAYAEGLLSTLGTRPAAVILDIGGNDVGSCLNGGAVPDDCIARAGRNLSKNLDTILTRLRTVRPDVPVAILNLYDPFLGLWHTQPDARRQLIALHRQFLQQVNATIATAAQDHGALLADLGGRLSQTQTPQPGDTDPPAVRAICANTWMCVTPPQVPDIHLRRRGYAQAAAALDAVLAPRLIAAAASP
ncbi:MAG: SGNH/GDSL hydrolase family protein [Patulibacter sp.]